LWTKILECGYVENFGMSNDVVGLLGSLGWLEYVLEWVYYDRLVLHFLSSLHVH